MNFQPSLPESDPGANPDLARVLSEKVVGQESAMKRIIPYVQMHQAGLAPGGRPVGVFLLLGPTGTGKTRTVEAMAEALHGNQTQMIKVNCGEYQLDHEVAKLIGAPPGYLGHGETQSVFTEDRMAAVTSVDCALSIILFDEIEKAAPALIQLLLGILDKATLRLGNASEVDFQDTLIFFTSNLGAREMKGEIEPGMGFRQPRSPDDASLSARLQTVSMAAVRRRFSPEFVNRIDVVVTYEPLTAESFSGILDLQIKELQHHIESRLGDRGFDVAVSDESRELLLRKGASTEFGARELKRVVHRYLTQPLAALVIEGSVPPGGMVRTSVSPDGESLAFACDEGTSPRPGDITILIVDDNTRFLDLLSEQMAIRFEGRIRIAESVAEAIRAMADDPPDVALFDVMLPDGSGVGLGVKLKELNPDAQIILMSGSELDAEETSVVVTQGFDFLPKPFYGDQLLALIGKGRRQTRVVGG
jgi:ATP-dependent Clp protease ATP-binding subunit ClpA/ActR/RegA family two-component response regulator